MAHHINHSAYNKLVERLNRFPQGAPPSELLTKILKILFSEQEAGLVSLMPIKPFTAQKASKIWKKDLVSTKNILDKLASRALLVDIEMNGETTYALPPPMAGFFEFSMMRVRDDIDQKVLSELFYQYLNNEDDFVKALFTEGDTRLGRTFIHEPVLTNENAYFQYSGGAGIFFWGVNLILNNVTISHNSALAYSLESLGIRGGGIYIDGVNAILENVTISDNYSYEHGGGICSIGTNTSLKNVVIFGNAGFLGGDGIYLGGGNMSLDKVIMTDNNNGGNNGIESSGGSISIINSIIWDYLDIESSSADITYSNIWDGYTGIGNISSNPLFAAGYHLQPTSPCIDAGHPDPQYDDPDGTIADMGAFYFHHLAPPVTNFTVDTLTGYSLFNFTDLTRHGSGVLDEWYWNFGDGNNSSLQNPAHEYMPGVYTVALTVTSDDDSTDTETKVDYITVYSTDDPASPTDLQIDIAGDDAVISWTAVDTTIFGDPINVDAYLVYYCGSADSVYYFLGLTTNTTYTHQYVAQFSDNMFYQVSAYVGELRILQSVITENPNFKIGELDLLIKEKRINKNYIRSGY